MSEQVAYLVGGMDSWTDVITDDGRGPTYEEWIGGVVITDLGRAEAKRAGVLLMGRGLMPHPQFMFRDGISPYGFVTAQRFDEMFQDWPSDYPLPTEETIDHSWVTWVWSDG